MWELCESRPRIRDGASSDRESTYSFVVYPDAVGFGLVVHIRQIQESKSVGA